MPQSDSSKTSQLPGRVNDSEYSALDFYAHELNGADAYQSVTKSDVVRWALYNLFLENWDELPQESKQQVDKDVLKGKLSEKPEIGGSDT